MHPCARRFLDAPSIAWSDSASGEYIQGELLARLGIETEVKKKGKQIPATPVGEVLAKGEAAFGCQQHSELQPVHGIGIVAELPDELQRITPYAAAIVKGAHIAPRPGLSYSIWRRRKWQDYQGNRVDAPQR